MQEMELLNTIIKSNPGISIDQAMEIYKSTLVKFYKATNEVRYSSTMSTQINSNAKVIDITPVSADLLCGYTRQDLKIKPENSITDDYISCCICGDKLLSLTSRHLEKHNKLTRAGYLALCKFGPNTKLSCHSVLKKRKEQIEQSKPWEKTKRAKAKAKEEAAKLKLEQTQTTESPKAESPNPEVQIKETTNNKNK